MSRVAVYPGTFDPPTLGHMDIIGRAALLFDRLIVGVFTNASKSPLFAIEDRLASRLADEDDSGPAVPAMQQGVVVSRQPICRDIGEHQCA